MHRIARLLSSVALILSACAATAAPLGFGTMSPGTMSYSSGAVIGRVMHEHLGLQVRVQPYAGETVLMPLLAAGELDFAIASVVEAGEAYAGRGAFAGKPQPQLRIAAVLFPVRVALFVRADSDIHTIADLAGRRVTSGFIAMGSIERLLLAILANGGLRIEDIEPVPAPNVIRGAEQFVNGRADAFFFAVGAARVREVDASQPLRMLPLAEDEGALAALHAVFAEGYSSTVPPLAMPSANRAPGAALTFDNLLLSAGHVPADTVAAVVAALATQHAELAAGFAPFRELRQTSLYKSGLPVPFHDGTLRWRETRP